MRRLSTGHALRTSDDSLTNLKGLNPNDISLNKQNFETLQRSLRQTDHLPYSLWPRRKSDVGHLSPLSRSSSRTQRFSITPVLLTDRDTGEDKDAPASAPGSSRTSDKEVFKF